MIDIARENREQTDATQRVLLAESYFGLRLAQEVVRVRQDTYNSLKRHYENALKLEAAGMIDKAGRLFAQVNMDEAQRSLEASQRKQLFYKTLCVRCSTLRILAAYNPFPRFS